MQLTSSMKFFYGFVPTHIYLEFSYEIGSMNLYIFLHDQPPNLACLRVSVTVQWPSTALLKVALKGCFSLEEDHHFGSGGEHGRWKQRPGPIRSPENPKPWLLLLKQPCWLCLLAGTESQPNHVLAIWPWGNNFSKPVFLSTKWRSWKGHVIWYP